MQRPININVSPHSIIMPIPHAHIYPVDIQIAKPTTIKEVKIPFLKKGPYHMQKLKVPYHTTSHGHKMRKKGRFGVISPAPKSVVIRHTN